MSVTQTITTVSPSQEIKAFTLSDEETNKTITESFLTLVSEYKTNELLATESVVSDDELTRTNTRKFVDQTAFDAFMAEPNAIAFFEARNNYNIANGITSTIVIT